MTQTRVKICGVTRHEDAVAAVELGAWAVGLNYWELSPRRCDPAVAAQIGRALKRRCEVAGVFVNATLDEIAEAADEAELAMIQLHGEEGPSFCSEVARRTGAKVIKATRVRTAADIQALEAFRTDYHLLDAHLTGTPGGTGLSFDWSLAAGRRSQIPLILAGGIRPDNAAEAIAAVRPFAIDVASGVESEPGIKDHNLIRDLIRAANPEPIDDAEPANAEPADSDPVEEARR